jgi:CheY-like chemotaxis protein
MGGDVGVESEEGKGARIWFRIQADKVQGGEESRLAERQGRGATATPPAVSAGYVLIVDDNAVNRKVVEAILRKQGVRSESVEDGQVALDRIMAGALPNLILMDCQMPVMNGYEATERIRQWEKDGSKPHIPIIALTAGAFQEDRDQCVASGMDGFLTKPVNIHDLMAVVEKWMA